MATRNPNLNILPSLKRVTSPAEMAVAEQELCGPRGEWWWTGKHPQQCPGFDAEAGVLRSLPLPNCRTSSRGDVLDYFDNTWTLTEVLFASLQGSEAFLRQPYHQLRHPMMFYYVHPAVLYVNKFRVAGLMEAGLDQYSEQLFETGVDEMSWDDLSQAREDWPSVREAHAYRAAAYKAIRHMLETAPCMDAPGGWDCPSWAVFMGFEHERIHIETSSVLIRELPVAFVRKPEFWPDYHPTSNSPSTPAPTPGVDYPSNPLLEVAGGQVVLGKPLDYPSFGFDNEYGSKALDVPGFRASKYKVTNGEFHAFVKAGGYTQAGLWSKEGWGWRTFRNVKWPTFWVPDGPAGLHRYQLRLLFDAVPMRWDWPAEVNYHEAQAFAAWRTRQDGSLLRYRLVTEAEHMLLRNSADRVDAPRVAAMKAAAAGSGGMAVSCKPVINLTASAASGGVTLAAGPPAVAANGVTPKAPRLDPKVLAASELDAEVVNRDIVMAVSGTTAAKLAGFNFQLAYSSASPVTALPPSSAGFHDTLGNVWEWGEDHFAALPGFKLHPYYDDFSAPCFGGLHHMIIGGSFISTGQLASKFARYQFRPHFFQHAGFRLVVAALEDLSAWDSARHSPEQPILPFFETSCMDAAEPYIGDRPCCSSSRRDRCTPTMAEQRSQDEARLAATKTSYETDSLLSQYLSLHFGPLEIAFKDFMSEQGILSDGLDFPRKCGDLVRTWAAKAGVSTDRALDLGCAVGRSTFELARDFKEVVGIDISQRFIDMANQMKASRAIPYELKVEADIVEQTVARIDADIDVERTTFLQGDACALPPGLGTFQAVLAANLLCRVPDPAACLAQMDGALAPGGLLVLTSPFTWLEEYTAKDRWLGGRQGAAGATPLRCADALKAALAAKGYSVLDEGRIPLVIRETCRKYQVILAHRLVAQKSGASAAAQ